MFKYLQRVIYLISLTAIRNLPGKKMFAQKDNEFNLG